MQHMQRQYRLINRVPEGGEPHCFAPTTWEGVLSDIRAVRRHQRGGIVRKDVIMKVQTREHGPSPWEEHAS